MRAVLIGLALSLCLVSGQNTSLSETDIETVTTRLAEGATKSWELGTRAQSLLEFNVPNFSVFSSTGVPPPSTVPSNTTSAIAPVFSIAKNAVSALSNATGPKPLINGDGAAGDPAAIGVAVLLANWTGQGADGLNYAAAAQNQLDYLFNVVPHTSDGAISHRVAQVQLWSDFVYMVPPFLAYYGVLTGNTTLITEAYNQIKLYRNYLRDTSANNLWKHIVLGNDTNDTPNDSGHWSTGNAWAAAGMLRVIGAMKNSQYSKSFSSQQKDLGNWVKEIHSAMYANIDSTNIFTNYADVSINTTGSFYDTASTTLLASTVYRASLLLGDHSHLPNAEKCRQALYATSPLNQSSSAVSSASSSASSSIDPSSASSDLSSASSSIEPSSASLDLSSASVSDIASSKASTSATSTAPAASASATTAAPLTGLLHFTNSGWLTPVVNPDSFGVEGQNSPEGEAFVLQFQAAYSEWVSGGSVGANAARRTASSVAGWPWVVGCAVFGTLLTLA